MGAAFRDGLGADGPEMLAQAKQLAADGWQTIRFVWAEPGAEADGVFEPRESIPATAECLAGVRSELGHGIALWGEDRLKLHLPLTLAGHHPPIRRARQLRP